MAWCLHDRGRAPCAFQLSKSLYPVGREPSRLPQCRGDSSRKGFGVVQTRTDHRLTFWIGGSFLIRFCSTQALYGIYLGVYAEDPRFMKVEKSTLDPEKRRIILLSCVEAFELPSSVLSYRLSVPSKG